MKKYEVYYNHSVKEFNTFRIGGKAKYLVIVYDIDTLHRVCIDCCTHNIKYKVIGLGANLLFADTGYDGAIIVNRSDSVRIDKDTIIADSGVAMARLINFATEHSLSRLENFVGIPSTLGGAIVNNLMFLFVSIPMADKRQSAKPGFDEYKRATRGLLPLKFGKDV